jgi:pSer/pThr/pTyr-binding forkhead associated (FHA) protein
MPTDEQGEDLMTPRLIEPGSDGKVAREIQLLSDEFLMGRGTDCDLRLHDVGVSRHHCLIRRRAQESTLVDLGSSNGTFVNGSRVVSQVALQPGDEIRLGEARYFFDDGVGEQPSGVNLAATLKIANVKKTASEPGEAGA